MLITFTASVHADVTMLGDVALKLIKLMGRSGTVPSAIGPEDIPQAMKLLREGIAVEDAGTLEQVTHSVEGESEQQVSLHNRALPLIGLLNAASKENVSVMWAE